MHLGRKWRSFTHSPGKIPTKGSHIWSGVRTLFQLSYREIVRGPDYVQRSVKCITRTVEEEECTIIAPFQNTVMHINVSLLKLQIISSTY